MAKNEVILTSDDLNLNNKPFQDKKAAEALEKTRLSPKLLVFFITVLALISLVFSVGNWLNGLKTGFAIRGDVENEFLNKSTAENLKDNDITKVFALQNQDSDLDGLSDYDELYLYKTSPYLADSDSDGFSDSVEVNNKENPNCPAGQSCGVNPPSSSIVANLEDLGNLTNEQVRQLLLDKGMNKEELDKIDDNTLRSVYLETFKEFETSQQSSANSAPAASNFNLAPAEGLGSITPEQLRAILKTQEGINPADIDLLNDEQLMQLWSELLASSASE